MFAVTFSAPPPNIDMDAIFSEARARLGIKQEEIATLFGIKEPQLSAQIHDPDGRVCFRRMLQAALRHPRGAELFACLIQIAARRYGIPFIDKTFDAVLDLVAILSSDRKQLQSDLQKERERTRQV